MTSPRCYAQIDAHSMHRIPLARGLKPVCDLSQDFCFRPACCAHDGRMTSFSKPRGRMRSHIFVGAAVLALGLTVTSCAAPQTNATQGSGTTPQGPSMSPPTSATSATATDSPSAPVASSSVFTATQEKTLSLSVSGEATAAMVKTLVITRNGKETGGQMIRQSLPFSQDIVIPAGSELTKVLVLGKNVDGANNKLTCAINLAGETLKESSSRGHAPAECLFLGAGAE